MLKISASVSWVDGEKNGEKNSQFLGYQADGEKNGEKNAPGRNGESTW